jgi:hypothetical protein
MAVAKSGRTTGLSCSSVFAISARVCVGYSPDCGNPTTLTICYSGQVIAGGGSFTQPGDSGSLILAADTAQPLGLVVGGNGSFTSANPVGNILTALQSGTGSTFRFVGAGQHRISCAQAGTASREELRATSTAMPDAEIAHAIAVRKRNESQIMKQAAVFGMGVGDNDLNPGHPAVVIFVDKGRVPGHLPAALEGVPVRVIKTARFRATPLLPNHNAAACSRSAVNF